MAKRDHELFQAIADERRARLAFVTHYKGCYSCYAARRDNDWLKACDEGWNLAKVSNKAYYDLYTLREQRTQGPSVDQLTLF